jgi:Holliday junction DNA helicase RuvA
MIAYLKGSILEKGLTYLIVETNNIGYKVFVTPENLEKAVGDEVRLFTYMKVSEDGQSLFGLPDFLSLQFFEMLITVSGVGPKVAMAILSSGSVDAVKAAIANQDAAAFTRIAGVGTKTAEKIIVELKNKVGVLSTQYSVHSTDVFDALTALGYGQKEVREVLNKLDHSLGEKEQLKQALKFLGK